MTDTKKNAILSCFDGNKRFVDCSECYMGNNGLKDKPDCPIAENDRLPGAAIGSYGCSVGLLLDGLIFKACKPDEVIKTVTNEELKETLQIALNYVKIQNKAILKMNGEFDEWAKDNLKLIEENVELKKEVASLWERIGEIDKHVTKLYSRIPIHNIKG